MSQRRGLVNCKHKDTATNTVNPECLSLTANVPCVPKVGSFLLLKNSILGFLEWMDEVEWSGWWMNSRFRVRGQSPFLLSDAPVSGPGHLD